MEVIPLAKLNIAFLWSYPQVQGWIAWTDERVAGSTKRNKALHLINLLVWLDSESAVTALASKEVTHCLKILHTFSKLGKQQYNQSVTKAMNNNQLVAASTALHNKEQPVFILWLLN